MIGGRASRRGKAVAGNRLFWGAAMVQVKFILSGKLVSSREWFLSVMGQVLLRGVHRGAGRDSILVACEDK